MNFIDQSKQLNIDKKDLSFIDKVILVLFGCYFVMSPFYLWRSGLPQIADFTIIIALTLALIKTKFRFIFDFQERKIITVSLLFLYWIVLNNSFWSLRLGIFAQFFINNGYYLFNIFIFIMSILLIRTFGKYLYVLMLNSIIFSLLIQFVMFITSGGYSGGRYSGTFNNPNQLGYYAILVTALILITITKSEKVSLKPFIGILISFILVIVSLSNAAIISWSIMLFCYVFFEKSNKKFRKKLFIISLITLIIGYFIYINFGIIQNNALYEALVGRLSTTQNKIEAVGDVRGYNRILGYPEYWLLGAGEGAYFRFEGNLELHSTLGNIQISYGIIGTIIFLRLLYVCLKNIKFRYWYIILAVMVYGMTHNGIRDSIFWILLAFIFESYKYNREVKHVN